MDKVFSPRRKPTQFGVWCGIAFIICSSCNPRPTHALRRDNDTLTFPTADVGDRLCIADVHFSADRQFVLATSKNCPACRASTKFYEMLSDYCIKHSIPLYVLVQDDSTQASDPQEGFGFVGTKIIQTRLGPVGLIRVPSLALVGRTGTITALWVGTVPKARQSELLHKLCDRDPEVSTRMEAINMQEFEQLRSKGPIQFVDPRNPRERPDLISQDAVEMPSKDVSVRAKI